MTIMQSAAASSPSKMLEGRLRARTATIGIIGLGYVGLPLARTFARRNLHVIGFDIDAEKVASLNEGTSYIRHIPGSAIAEIVDTGMFRATTDFAQMRSCDAVLICVPTPLTRHREPDLSYVVSTAEAIHPHLTSGQLVVLESTTYPGTTEEVLRPILELSGLKAGSDFFLAFSPEREDPGNQSFETATIPKVVGGEGEALRMACVLYDQIVPHTVPVSSCSTAEAVKLTENIFRAVNIALVNELKVVYERMGIDIWEVIEAAKSKPFGFMPFYPSAGLGGHCIPIDPFYLTWKAREFDLSTRFVELAGEVNAAMPAYVVDRLAFSLDQRFRKAVNGARVLVVGLAYKKNVDDMRESPAFKVIELLERRGSLVEYHDPLIPEIRPTREHAEMTGRRSVVWSPLALGSFDAAVIITDHDCINWQELVDNCPLVVDTRNATKDVRSNRQVIVKA